MNERFEVLKNEIADYHNNLDDEKRLQAELLQKRIERDKSILKNTGVIELFEEIRDKGLLYSRLKTAEELKERPFFFPSPEDRLDYIPANVCIDVNHHNLRGGADVKDDTIIHASLEFGDIHMGGDDMRRIAYNVVRVAVVGDGICLVSRNENYEYEYAPIQDGKLVDAVSKGIKNPIRIS